jgi:TRAP-type C4-dicarboxylate transport system permease small subunit
MSHPDHVTRRPQSGFRHRYEKVLDAFDAVMSIIVTVVMGVLASVVILQVFFRYVLNYSLTWGWDIPRLCFIWVVLLSIPLAFRYNAHVGVEVDLSRLGIVNTKALRRFNALFMMVLFGLTAYHAMQLMRQTWDQMMPGIDLSVGLFYFGLVVGQIHCCLHVGRILIFGEPLTEVLSET